MAIARRLGKPRIAISAVYPLSPCENCAYVPEPVQRTNHRKS